MSGLRERVAALNNFAGFSGVEKRCSCCEVSRPIEFFPTTNKGNGAIGRRSNCSACNSNPVVGSPRGLKKIGAPLDDIQHEANARIDSIRRKRGWPEFSFIEHVASKTGYSEREHVPEDRRREIINTTVDLHVARAESRPERRRREKAERKQQSAEEKAKQSRARRAKLARKHASMNEEELIVAAVRRAIRTAAGAKSRVKANNLAIDENRPISIPKSPPSKRKKWNLTPKQLGKLLKDSQMKCAVSGVRFEMAGADIWRPRHPLAPSLDQKKPGAGYTYKNAQLVCWMLNNAKSDLKMDIAIEAFLAIAEGIRARK